MRLGSNKAKSQSKGKTTAYWLVTALVCFELVYGALWDFNLLNKGYVKGILEHLGYPLYLGNILGVSKLLATVVFLSPGLLLLKEWAYAGIVILFGAAHISHLIVGDPPQASMFSLIFCLLTVLSWWLRPAHHRLVPLSGQTKTMQNNVSLGR